MWFEAVNPIWAYQFRDLHLRTDKEYRRIKPSAFLLLCLTKYIPNQAKLEFGFISFAFFNGLSQC